MTSAYKWVGGGTAGWGEGVLEDCRRRGALGRLGLREVGLEGARGTEEEGVGQRTGGAKRRDRLEMELQRSRISGPMREFAT